jgi:hypothetical protein
MQRFSGHHSRLYVTNMGVARGRLTQCRGIRRSNRFSMLLILSLHVCTCLCMCVCVCVCLYVCMCVCMCVCVQGAARERPTQCRSSRWQGRHSAHPRTQPHRTRQAAPASGMFHSLNHSHCISATERNRQLLLWARAAPRTFSLQ